MTEMTHEIKVGSRVRCEQLFEPAEAKDERKVPVTRIGCSMCGDDVPAMRTPRGWLCRDCAMGY